jgi:ketosteroid isomerase-like protein
MTASENLDLVRSIYAAWERGDYSSAAWAHPEIEYVILGAGVFPDVSAKGRAEMREAARANIDVWGKVRIAADEYRELDDERVLVLDHYSGHGKRSGLDIGQLGAKGCHLFHLDERKVTRLVFYGDRNRALADLGLAPEADSPDS